MREKYYIDKYDSINNGYNISEGGSTHLAKISEKEVFCISHNNEIVSKYDSLVQAGIAMKDKLLLQGEVKRISQTISDVCHNRRKFAYGFGWCFCNEIEDYKLSELNLNNKPVEQYTLDGLFVKSYNSIREAVRKTNIVNIGKCCCGERHKAGGYIWRFKEESK